MCLRSGANFPCSPLLGFKVQGNDLYTAATIQKLLFIFSSYFAIDYFIVFNQEDVVFFKTSTVCIYSSETHKYLFSYTVRCTRYDMQHL